MFPFLKDKSAHSTVAVFAVESGSVILTVVRSSSEGEKVIFIDRRDLDISESDSPSDRLRKASQNIEKIFQDLLARKSFHYVSKSRALVLLGSPFNISWKDKLSIVKDKPFRLTHEFMKDAIDQKFKSNHDGLDIISSHTMSVNMNGYKIKNPIGKLTPAVEFEMYVESAPKEVLQTISAAIEKHMPHSHLRFSTVSFASVESIVLSFKESNFIFVMPEHSVTEISLVIGGSIKSSASVPFGSGVLSHALFGQGANSKESMHKMHRFMEGKLDDNAIASVAKPLEEARVKFAKDFHDLLWAMNDSLLCPSTIFIGGKGIAAHFIREWLKKENYGSQTFTADCFKISNVAGIEIVDKSEFAGKSLPFYSAISVGASKSLLSSFDKSINDIK